MPLPGPTPAPAARGGLVLGCGSATELARCYAQALGRRFQELPADRPVAEALAAADRTESVLVVLPEPGCDLATVTRLVETARRHRIRFGLLPLSADPTEALHLVVRSWAAQVAPAPDHAHRTMLYCDFRREAPAGPALSYGSDGSEEFVTRLREGAQAVVLHSHGNGADFRVGSHVLCLQVDRLRPEPARPGERHLPCQGGGGCRLAHKTSFRAFHGAAALRARLLVLLSCSAYQPADGLLDARFQLSRTLLYGPHVAGFVASTRINHGTVQLGVAVERLLDQGASLGEVALRINLLAGEGLASYVCVGDPELAAPPAPARPAPARTAATRPEPARAAATRP
ncbi:hypothetical protein, partial [Kitasatospora sp. LaBMicrA B282]|uniref:hypothetical protein n=1 Tax=Kitasatospora sp. LaBMicrA B282 TaxID=3420949 RepID=UPI003D12D6E0